MDNSYQSTLEMTVEPRDELAEVKKMVENSAYDEALKLLEDIDSIEAIKIKAEILLNLKQFKQAVECYDEVLDLDGDEQILIKKADVLYRWAKVAYFPQCDYDLALKLISMALEIVPPSIEASELWFLKGEIHQSLNQHIDARRCFLKSENRQEEFDALESELEMFEAHRADVLINITGVGFYQGLEPFRKGETFSLIRDRENEHDPDAIAVVKDDEILGYVANSDFTLINGVKSASQIKNDIRDGSKAEVLFIFQNEFVISKVLF